MVKKTKADEPTTLSIEALVQQTMRENGSLFPLSDEDVRRAEIEIANHGVNLPTTLQNSFASLRRAHSRALALAHERSIIVVMPFMTISANEGDRSDVLDMADAISINLIDNYPHFIVKSPATVPQSQASSAELDADFIIQGRVKLLGGRVRAAVQLKSVRHDATVWDENYEEALHNIMMMEERIARDLAYTLNPALSAGNDDRAPRPERHKPSWEAYLNHKRGRAARNKSIRNYFYEQGQSSWNNLTENGLLEAIRYFRQATKIDPEFAQAFASTADSYVYLGLLGLIPSGAAFALGRRFALLALAKDQWLASAHTSLAFTEMFYERRWQKSEASFKDALTLNSKYTLAHVGYAQLLAGLGRFDEALEQINQALVDPTPLAVVVDAMIRYEARDFDSALAHLLEAKDKYRHFDQLYYALALIYSALGIFKKAQDMARIAVALSGHNEVKEETQIFVLAKAGQTAKALSKLRNLVNPHKEPVKRHPALAQCGSPFHMAAIYVALAENDKEQREEYYRQAFIQLRDACAKKDQFMFLLGVDPRFDSIREDSRFIKLLRKIKLEPLGVTA